MEQKGTVAHELLNRASARSGRADGRATLFADPVMAASAPRDAATSVGK